MGVPGPQRVKSSLSSRESMLSLLEACRLILAMQPPAARVRPQDVSAGSRLALLQANPSIEVHVINTKQRASSRSRPQPAALAPEAHKRARCSTNKVAVSDELLAEAVAAVGRRLSAVREYLAYRYFRDLMPGFPATRLRIAKR
jgi:hypothetical protein